MTDTSATRPVLSQSSDPTAPDVTGPPAGSGVRDPLRRTRAGGAWVGIIIFAAVLVLLLVFILQNTQPVRISYFGASGSVSLAVAMLLAAVAGVLLAAIAGSARIWQLRRHLRRPPTADGTAHRTR